MKHRPFFPSIVALILIPLAGCRDGQPLEPESAELAWEDEIALELLSDPTSTGAALELLEVQAKAGNGKGWGRGSADTHRSQAELAFREAQDAMAQGDLIRARDRARDGRRLVAESIQMSGGNGAIESMVERLEAIPLQIAADPTDYQNSGKLGLQIGQIAERARKANQQQDRTRAGQLGVLGEQVMRQQHERRHGGGVERTRLGIAMATEAIEMADEIISAPTGGADTEQQELLDVAKEYLAQAILAFEAGEEARAIHLARLAQWGALKAVVLPGGITDEEARFVLTLAETKLAKAGDAIQPDPTEIETMLFGRATRLFERGKASVEAGNYRGIGPLWCSAVTSSYLIGLE